MIISQKHKFLFIHVYKVAGTAIRKFLMDRGLGVPGHEIYPAIGENAHISAVKLREVIPRDVFDGYFKFAFVRNPWDFECSMYNYGVQKSFFPGHEQFKSFGSFKRYIKHKYYKHLEWIQSEAYDPGDGQQKNFVVDKDGRCLVDFVGRFEQLQQDFNIALRRVGLPGNEILPVFNNSNHARYVELYDPESIKYVAKIHANDIAYFGYTFDGARPDGVRGALLDGEGRESGHAETAFF